MSEISTCQTPMSDGKPCGRKFYIGKKCICHHESSDKDIHAFQKELDKIFADEKSEIFDMKSFVFPKGECFFPHAFEKKLIFQGAIFHSSIELGSVDYVEPIEKIEIKWGQITIIFEDVDFTGCVFKESLVLLHCSFHGKVDFDGSVFESGIKLLLSAFSKELSFSSCRFTGQSDFHANYFHRRFIFNNSCITAGGSVLFKGRIHDRDNILLIRIFEKFGEFSEFSGVKIERGGSLEFRMFDLTHCIFKGTDLSKIRFCEIKWPISGSFISKRTVIGDELKWKDVVLSSKTIYDRVAELYRGLQINYMSNFRFTEAGDFYIGEQEMMRRAYGSSTFYWWISSAYKLLSLYGESFLRPFIWFIGVLFGSPIMLGFTGGFFASLTPKKLVEFEWSWNLADFFLLKPEYWDAFYVNLSFLFLDKRAIDTRLVSTAQKTEYLLRSWP